MLDLAQPCRPLRGKQTLICSLSRACSANCQQGYGRIEEKSPRADPDRVGQIDFKNKKRQRGKRKSAPDREAENRELKTKPPTPINASGATGSSPDDVPRGLPCAQGLLQIQISISRRCQLGRGGMRAWQRRAVRAPYFRVRARRHRTAGDASKPRPEASLPHRPNNQASHQE